MSADNPRPVATPCLCNALRQASRVVSRRYDDELRGVGLRTTQFSLLQLLNRSGEVRQGDLGELSLLDDTTLTRSLRPLVEGGWISIRAGKDRREKWVAISEAGRAKLKEARPAWERAQQGMRTLLPDDGWQKLLTALHDVSERVADA
jgi:DNA-binding MarR family transcriptional regulator